MGNDKDKKLSLNQQIDDLKKKGVRFEIMSEAQARTFLEYNTYYFKLKSYLKAFDSGNIDFAYLRELSTLDYHFRKTIISMALDIEHLLKVKLIRDVMYDDTEDGYQIVSVFFKHHADIKDGLKKNARNSAVEGITPDDPDNMSVWNLTELLQLREFMELYYTYYTLKGDPGNQLRTVELCTQSLRYLRNAAAHNACLLSTLKDEDLEKVNESVYDAVDDLGLYSTKVLDKKMYCRTMHDFVSMIYLFCMLTDDEALSKMRGFTLSAISDKLHDRFVYHRDYFKCSSFLASNYEFITKLIDHLKENNFSF